MECIDCSFLQQSFKSELVVSDWLLILKWFFGWSVTTVVLFAVVGGAFDILSKSCLAG